MQLGCESWVKLRPFTAGVHVDQAGQGGWQQPNTSLPSLALNPRAKLGGGAGGKPKLSLSGFSTPAQSPSPVPSRRPPLLNGPSSSQTPTSRSADTPSLKLAIPGLGQGLGGSGGGTGFTSGHNYPDEGGLTTAIGGPGDDFADLRTPMAGDGEDRNPTIMARGNYDDGDSSYGYGRTNNGLGSNGDRMTAMTHDIRQALSSRSRFDTTPTPTPPPMSATTTGSLSRSTSHTDSGAGSRRSSGTATPQMDDLAALKNLSISHELGNIGSTGPPLEQQQEAVSGAGIPIINPDELTLIKRLGEGAGGSVDMVKDKKGKIMAKKVGPDVLLLRFFRYCSEDER